MPFKINEVDIISIIRVADLEVISAFVWAFLKDLSD